MSLFVKMYLWIRKNMIIAEEMEMEGIGIIYFCLSIYCMENIEREKSGFVWKSEIVIILNNVNYVLVKC